MRAIEVHVQAEAPSKERKEYGPFDLARRVFLLTVLGVAAFVAASIAFHVLL